MSAGTHIQLYCGGHAISDLRIQKIGLKIRDHTLHRVPYLLIAGQREVRDRTVAVRTRGGNDLGSMSIEQFIQRVESEIAHGVGRTWRNNLSLQKKRIALTARLQYQKFALLARMAIRLASS